MDLKKTDISFPQSGMNEIPAMFLSPHMCDHILSLDLHDNSIRTIPDSFFSSFSRVSTLDLRGNELTLIHNNIYLMQNLTILKLDNNRLSSLPLSIGKLPKLRILSLSHNNINSLPCSISHLSCTLENLNIAENNIKFLPEEIGTLNQLQTLDLYHNRFVSIPVSFSCLTNLEEFSLDWFRYVNPPLPTSLKGELALDILFLLRTLCREIEKSKMRELTVFALIQYLSKTPLLLLEDPSILHKVAYYNDLGILEAILLHHPKTIDYLDTQKRSALCIALSQNNSQAALMLIKNGADIQKGVGEHGSLLHLAVLMLDTEIIKLLLKQNIGISEKDRKGNTPL